MQGVGFRYRACYIASSLGVTGWVRNNWDDRVEMEAQGSRELLAQLRAGCFFVELRNMSVSFAKKSVSR